jgi:RHH-type proline utilization regulon transcriptional repressor/proline dehydrogenase/delta 1-pyrroline-5-carboxylate dehydrogenase
MDASNELLGMAFPARDRLRRDWRREEAHAVADLLRDPPMDAGAAARASDRARRWIEAVRADPAPPLGVDRLLAEFPLSSREGLALMRLAEALIRIPDSRTADALIREVLAGGRWDEEPRTSRFGRLLGLAGRTAETEGLVHRLGEPLMRAAIASALRLLARRFVLGETIAEAVARTEPGWRYSFDMLGEAALTAADAERNAHAHEEAIASLALHPTGDMAVSVKLSALHPRFEFAKAERLRGELWPRLRHVALQARAAGVALTLDAEEADRLEPTLDLFERLAADPALTGWDGLGIAVQAYQKRAPALVDWLAELARGCGRRIAVRLVKGAYWDAEIKRAQVAGLDDYPVFTRKSATDVCYLACARALLAETRHLYPAFATHNAHTAAAVAELAGGPSRDFEFQRLQGMGEALHRLLLAEGYASRVYAPVGRHRELLPYLVRRLLENGANASFVHLAADPAHPVEDLSADPIARLAARPYKPNPAIPLPVSLYGEERPNSQGVDLADPSRVEPLLAAIAVAAETRILAGPILDGRTMEGAEREIFSPADRGRLVGLAREADAALVDRALASARRHRPEWDALGGAERARRLEKAAFLLESRRAAFLALLIHEAGKTLPDALAELREGVDFLRYYAARARLEFEAPETGQGPTGERNETRLGGRGVFACISPWNFPLAIFLGQAAAALAAGNGVVAKPAGATPLVAWKAVRLLHEAGVPGGVLHFLPGPGGDIGKALLAHPDLSGIAFTGSGATAKALQRGLAERPGPILPLIAETGGQNAMIVDSSALPEQAVRDILASAFQSAGQRCSALRVLFVQEEAADRLLGMLAGAVEELEVGDPARPSTDVGPLIDTAACLAMAAHAANLGRPLAEARRPADGERSNHYPPQVFEIDGIDRLKGEIFGPILHVIRFSGDRLDAVVDAVNATGYGLTLGIHSRLEGTVKRILARARVGNAYVNRNQIGAVVGLQPFGGEGLSGTGPKAGGPRYLHRFAVERTVAVNTAATGGDAALLALNSAD